MSDTKARIVEESFHYVIQRKHRSQLLSGSWVDSWVDSSGKYHGEDGEAAVMPECTSMQKIFGKGEVRVVRRDVLITEDVVEEAPKTKGVIGTVILPEEDVKTYGGPSGGEMCRWVLELPDGSRIGCQKTAGHHRLKDITMTNHLDLSLEVGWDATGRSWDA